MDGQRLKDLEKTLDRLYGHWRKVRRETIRLLGDREALKIVDFHGNNWIDIVGWVSAEYERKEQLNIVYVQWLRLFKEIYWLQFLFYTGNYATAYRNLRYMWEMVSQAHYVDSKYPALSLDKQFERAKRIEEERVYAWKVVSSALRRVLNKPDEEVHALFHPLWDSLNIYVHPSAIQMDMVAEKDFSGLVTDSFSEPLAKELQAVTDEVMDIIYAIVLTKFPKAAEHARNYKFVHEWQECLPNTMRVINGGCRKREA